MAAWHNNLKKPGIDPIKISAAALVAQIVGSQVGGGVGVQVRRKKRCCGGAIEVDLDETAITEAQTRLQGPYIQVTRNVVIGGGGIDHARKGLRPRPIRWYAITVEPAQLRRVGCRQGQGLSIDYGGVA